MLRSASNRNSVRPTMVHAFEDWIDQHDVADVTYWNNVDGSGYHG